MPAAVGLQPLPRACGAPGAVVPGTGLPRLCRAQRMFPVLLAVHPAIQIVAIALAGFFGMLHATADVLPLEFPYG